MWLGPLRTQREEILDQLVDGPRATQILADLDRWNQRTGWFRAHVRRVHAHWRALGEPRPFRVLDVGTGHGGLLDALATRGEQEGIPLELSGVDLHPAYVEMARRRLGGRATVFQGDATALDAPDQRWDLATCALMMHHLPYPVREALVAELRRTCRGVYLFDLECTWHGWAGASLAMWLAGLGADARADGILSIRRGATFAEFKALVAPLPVRAVRVFPTSLATLPA